MGCQGRCRLGPSLGSKKKTNKQKTHKHFSDRPCGTIVPGTNPHPSQGQTGQNGDFTVELNRERPVCPRDGSHFVPRRGPICLGRFLFVPDAVPPKMFMFIGFLLARFSVHHEGPMHGNSGMDIFDPGLSCSIEIENFGSPLTPPFLRGVFVLGFLPIFALSIGRTPQTKNGGYENGGLLTLESPLTPFF